MNDVEVGAAIRSVRIRRGLRQRDVADAAGVSQALVSLIEHGRLEETSLKLVRRVGAAVGVSLPVSPRWRGADLPRLLDERHAATVREVIARLTKLGWVTLPEHTFNVRGERGSIDVFAWFPSARAVLVVEVKTEVVDLQDLLSTHDRKRRLAPAIARDVGWKPLIVGALLVMPDETQARHAVERHGPVFEAAYPVRGPVIRSWLRRPERDVRGIWFVLNFTAGDGKRRPGGVFRVRPKRDRAAEVGPRPAGADRTGPAPPDSPSAVVHPPTITPTHDEGPVGSIGRVASPRLKVRAGSAMPAIRITPAEYEGRQGLDPPLSAG